MTSRKSTARARDKRVFDIHATVAGERDAPWRLLAISADSTVLALHLALLGAFDWKGDYLAEEAGAYRVTIGKRIFSQGRGSRTALRRVLATEESFTCNSGTSRFSLQCRVVREYEVPSRRHHPKVLEGDPSCNLQTATWEAQGAMRRELRGAPAPIRLERSREYLHGFFSAIVSGPLVSPAQWLGEVIGIGAFDDLGQANAAANEVMQFYNLIASGLYERQDEYIEQVASLANADSNGEALLAWWRGYDAGMAAGGAEWQLLFADQRFKDLFHAIRDARANRLRAVQT